MGNNITIYDVEQGSEAWFDLRCGRITASKFKDLMSGMGTLGYKGLVAETCAQILSKTFEESYSSAAMERGIELEPEARSFYEEIHDIQVDEIGFVTNKDIHEEFIGVSPDGRIHGTNGILEIKCPYGKTHVDYLAKDLLPNTYKWQVQGQLLITGAEFCDFMSYYPGIKPFIKRIYPNEEMHLELKERMRETVQEINRVINLINQK